MKKTFFTCLLLWIIFFCCAFIAEGIKFTPIEHASFVIEADNLTIYVDPVGEQNAYKKFRSPDIVLITHSHYDHFSKELLDKIKANSVVIGPQDVIDSLGYGKILNNGQETVVRAVKIKAMPMYNLSEDRLKFHQKGKGNGYVLTLNSKNIYISGDTEDIPEMRNLKDIDYAFICINLPYTMTESQAAAAVLDFKPKTVFPYHYRGKDRISDLDMFEQLVSKDKDIKVVFLDWYK
jgi:L-ascorbate metabolism protein UlaG (beta-lactamase superfamily)